MTGGHDVIQLTDLPLADHAAGVDGTVADAARLWRSRHREAIDRDLAATRAEQEKVIADEAYLRGVSDGRAAAEQDGLALLRELRNQLDTAVAATDKEVAAQLQLQSHDIIASALVIARWALGRELSQTPEALLDVVSDALRESGGMEGSRVYVHPELGMAASRWASKFGVERPEIFEDTSLDPGSVTIRSGTGGVGSVSITSILDRAVTALDADPSLAHGSPVLSEETAAWREDSAT